MTESAAAIGRPRIVVTVGVAARQRDPRLAARKNQLYAEAVARHGGDPVLVDASAAAPELREAFASMDGLVLSGGPDVHPARYGQPIRGAHATEDDRDDLEAAAWSAASARALPVLGICRGLQAINVFLGGRLVQHVDGHAGPPYGHGAALRHPLRVVAGTRLAAMLGDGAIEDGGLDVNTYHHQAVTADGLASGVVASAWAASGDIDLIEGLELTGDRFVLGVQCHPERTESTPPAFEALWAGFVAACRGRQES